MTTTELIKLLQKVEHGASGRSREIRIYAKNKKGKTRSVLREEDILIIYSTGDGVAGAELSLFIESPIK